MKKYTSAVTTIVVAAAITCIGSWARAQQKPADGGHAGAPAAPQDDRSTWVTRFYDLKHARAQSVAMVIGMFSGTTNVDIGARRVIWSGPPALAPAIEDAVARLDVAPPVAPSLELTFHILRAGVAEGGGGSLPADLEGVAKQVRSVFAVTTVSLVETAMLRTSAGQHGRLGGRVKPWAQRIDQAEYSISFGEIQITEDAKGRSVRLPNLGFDLSIIVISSDGKARWNTKVNLDTSIDVREGQKAVVGKASVDRTDDTILLVVTARTVD
ncbi:MAG: hypothetical protein HY825_04625 [Acidobacteria bacterium]|nr:hypothetical protein [Acidobacteriota bacterium]